MVSTGTQTSADNLRLPSRSPSSLGAVPVTPLSNRKVDAASSAYTSGQGLTPPAPPGPLAPKGRGLPPRSSAPQRKPGEPPKQSTSKGQLPAATDELMDESGPRSEEDAPLSGSESSFSVASSYAQAVHRGPVRPMVSTGTQTSTDDLRLPSRSPASSGAVPVIPLSNRKVDAASSASTSGQGLTSPAPPGPLAPKGRGLPPRTSAPQRKPGEPPKQSTSRGQLPAETDEPMDEAMDTMAPKEVSPPKASGVVPLAPPSVLKEGPSQTTSSKELERTPSSSARSSGRGRALPTPASTSSRKPGQLDEAYSTASQQSADEMMDESMPPSDDDLVPSGGTCESRCLEGGVSTDPEPCGFARPRMAVRGFPVSGEKGILVVEPSPG
ncbi:hypothetical protein ISCGN_009674 [Ixodes scapularis]